MTRKALGRGLGALLPGGPTPGPTMRVPVAALVPNPEQPRRHFDEEALAALADSIARHGLLQPLVVRPVPGGYEVIAGERRLRAAIRAGLTEEAEAYRHLSEVYGMTQEEIAARVGKSRPAITNTLRLLTLPDAVKAQLEAGELSAGHARAVLSIEGVDEQVKFAREVVARKLSKAETERLAQRRRRLPLRSAAAAADLHLRALAEELTSCLGTRVRIARRPRGGTIEIEFYSDAELDRLADRLRGIAARP